MLGRTAFGVLSLLLAMPGVTAYTLVASERRNARFAKPAKDGPPEQQTSTVPFVLDHNRVFVEVEFVKPDGTIRKAFAFVDMGDQDLELTESLAKELQLDQDKDLRIRIGGTPLVFDQEKLTAAASPGETIMAGAGKAETNLPASILMGYDVVFDYKARTMTLAAVGGIQHEGVRVPCRVNPKTGLVSVEIKVGRQSYAVTIDNGSAYTWVAKRVASGWIGGHPDWSRGVGAIGHANMNGREAEASALMLRIPLIAVGPVQLQQVGLAGYTEMFDHVEMFDWYSKKAPEPVVGFIGGNVLKSFRVEIDYAHKATYWWQESPAETDDMHQVPLVLRPAQDGSYTVIGIFTKDGKKQMEGVFVGDKLIKVGDLATKTATLGAVIEALHGPPGAARTLLLERDGKQFTITARIMAF
jgi:hypothetical protein